MRVTICKRFDFDAAHQLDRLPPDHKCHRMHGHTYRVEIYLTGGIDERTGMLVDYAQIEKVWLELHATLDHRVLNDVPGLEVPTTEVLVHEIWKYMRAFLLPRDTDWSIGVRVYESSTTFAQYPPLEFFYPPVV